MQGPKVEAPGRPRPPAPSRARNSAIVLRDLTKRYGRRTAVDRLTIEVPTGAHERSTSASQALRPARDASY